MRETKSTCCYCGVGCGVIIESDGAQVIGVRGDPAHPANFGKLCSKGSNLHLTAQPLLQQQVRALYPEMRTARNQERQRVNWDVCLETLADKFVDSIQTHGVDSVGFYISGQLLTEDYYVFNKLAKGLIGTNNIDSNSRLCMSSAVAGYKQSLGADAPPCSYEDIELADLIFIAGSNTAYAHPILYRRIEQARENNPTLKVIVVDPRRTDTARDADLHLAILPGTDVALFHGMLHLCLWEDLIDTQFIAEHTEGFAELKQTLRDFTPALTAQICGIAEKDLVQAARWFGQSKAALSLYCQGLNQSSAGTAKNSALINLHLATGQIGKPGAGPFSLTGQPNAMGGREVGGMANLLSAHRDLNNPEHRAEVAAMWEIPEVPEQAGKTAVEMFEAVRTGEIKIIWIVCTNPAQSMPDQNLIRAALEKAELVIVQEAYHNTATVAYADLLLPASTWSEKSGTVTNSERRISRVRAALPALGEARHDWQIATKFAQKLGQKLNKTKPDFAYDHPETIWNEHRDCTAGRDLDITGLSYALLEENGPQQWPFPTGATTGKNRLYQDHQFATANGKAHFINCGYVAPAEKITPRHPFALNTGRLRDQWHGMSRTGLVAQLYAHAPEPCIEMATQDMQRRFINDGDFVEVSNQRGTQILIAKASEQFKAGQSFIAMHWGEEFVSGSQANQALFGVNSLCNPRFDPISKQPELKHSAVKIAKIDLTWQFLACAWVDPSHILNVQQTLRRYYPHFTYASCVLFGRERQGLLFRAAHSIAVAAEVIHAIERLLGLHGEFVLQYDDIKRGTGRKILIETKQTALPKKCISGFSLAGDIAAENWLKQLLLDEEALTITPTLLARSQPAVSKVSGSQQDNQVVCTCFNIKAQQIKHSLSSHNGDEKQRLSHLQQTLACGTNCGSCIPQLKQFVREAALID